MKTENLVLISDNSEVANQRITEMRQQATNMTALIQAFNSLPILSNIETAENAKALLTDGIGYLNNAVLNDTGFKSKATPSLEKVAELYGINYGAIRQKINTARVNVSTIGMFSFDESNLTVELLPDSEEKIREESKLYLSDSEEIAEYDKVKTLCDDLNDYFTRYHLDAISMNQIPSATGLRCVGKRPGPGYLLIPNIEMIKKLLNK